MPLVVTHEKESVKIVRERESAFRNVIGPVKPNT